jgi:hypothetical protein
VPRQPARATRSRSARLSVSTSRYLPASGTLTVGRYYSSATVTLRPAAFDDACTATVTASYHGRSRLRTITIDPGLASFSLSPCSEPNCVGPDVLFTGEIPAGRSSATFTATSVPVDTDSEVFFIATLGTTTVYSADVDITPSPLPQRAGSVVVTSRVSTAATASRPIRAVIAV